MDLQFLLILLSPFGIEKLFPSIIYSLNPDKLIQGIASLGLLLIIQL